MRGRFAGLLPWSLFFAVFGLVPLLAALVLSFYSMNPLRPDLTHWVGGANYARALGSPAFWHALRTTAIFVVGTLPVTLVLAYVVAALLSRLRRGEAFFRAAIFFPATLSMVVISLVFKSLYAEQGLLNGWLKGLGFPAVHWLQDPRLALPSIMAMDVWASVGYYAILILAGRKTLPVEQLEAARLEGMRALAIERRIILPHVKPVILFVDDEMEILSALRRCFRHEPYVIYTALGPAEGMRNCYDGGRPFGFRGERRRPGCGVRNSGTKSSRLLRWIAASMHPAQ